MRPRRGALRRLKRKTQRRFYSGRPEGDGAETGHQVSQGERQETGTPAAGLALLTPLSRFGFPASSDNLARLWCVETGEIKREYSGHQKAVVCLAFNDSVLG